MLSREVHLVRMPVDKPEPNAGVGKFLDVLNFFPRVFLPDESSSVY